MKDYADDSTVFMTKTHFNHFKFREFNAQKCLLLVRNPFDVMVSYFHLKVSGTHDVSVEDAFVTQKAGWEAFAKEKFDAFAKLYGYWITQLKRMPNHIVRYEDLISDKKETLLDVFRFFMNTKDLEGTLL